MQKKIIALAVAGLMSGAAFAQSNVTVYGVVDAGYRASSGDDVAADTKTGIDSGNWLTSRIGFKGEEALGNGLKAIFTLEYGLNTDTNTGINTARQQYVGLSGDFGTAFAGRVNSPGKIVNDKYDVMGGSTAFSTSQNIQQASGSTMNDRLSNTAVYVSPTLMGGLTLVGAYSFAGASETDGNAYEDEQERVIGFSADYSAGGLGLAYVYHGATDVGTQNATNTAVEGTDVTEHFVVGSYDFGVVRLMASYLNSELDVKALGDADWDVYTVGAVMPLGGGHLRASYSENDFDASKLNSDNWTIAYTYDMSKRTTLYVGYTAVSNDDFARTTVFDKNGVTPDFGSDAEGYSFGVSHRF